MDEKLLIKYNFFSTAINDILKALQGRSLTGAFILTFCGMDYMGLALHPGRKNTKNDFKEYVKYHMGKYDPRYIQYADHLYAIRCSLVHSYGPSNAIKELDFGVFLMYYEPLRIHHLLMEKENDTLKLYVVLPELVSDYIFSVIDFFEENKDQDFSVWLRQLFFVTGWSSTMSRKAILDKGYFEYGEINSLLTVFDNNDEPWQQKDQLIMKLNNIISPGL